MKKLLAIVVLGLLWGGNASVIAEHGKPHGDFYLYETTPKTLMEMGFKLFSVERQNESGSVFLYTFIKDQDIVSCEVYLSSYRGFPSENHECYNITGLDRN